MAGIPLSVNHHGCRGPRVRAGGSDRGRNGLPALLLVSPAKRLIPPRACQCPRLTTAVASRIVEPRPSPCAHVVRLVTITTGCGRRVITVALSALALPYRECVWRCLTIPWKIGTPARCYDAVTEAFRSGIRGPALILGRYRNPQINRRQPSPTIFGAPQSQSSCR